MLIKNFPVGQLETNCYIVTNEDSLSCVMIDPGAESNMLLDYLDSNNLKLEAIFLTHGHFDHTLAADAVCEETGAPIWICKADANSKGRHDALKLKLDKNICYYSDGDIISAAGLTFYILGTPGHSPGSVTIKCESVLFTGDTLFRDTCGRTDFEGGSESEMYSSLRRIASLPGDFEVYPGHGPASSLERERMFNPYVKFACLEE